MSGTEPPPFGPRPAIPPPPDTRCPLCATAAGGLRVERCPECNFTLAGVDGRPGPYSPGLRRWILAGFAGCYGLVAVVVLLAR